MLVKHKLEDYPVIALSMRPAGQEWGTMAFASTLYLSPVLDILLADIPSSWQPELRLGLQEALINAAKHGNGLDPSKKVKVRFSVVEEQYWWIISDEGCGFLPPPRLSGQDDYLPDTKSECGRGLCLLHKIFDHVYWNSNGTELRLGKSLRKPSRSIALLANFRHSIENLIEQAG